MHAPIYDNAKWTREPGVMVLRIGDLTTTSYVGELADTDWRGIVQRAADKLAEA